MLKSQIKLQETPIQIIRWVTAGCSSLLLDRVIVHECPGPLRNFIQAVAYKVDGPFWMDIPIQAVVGLHHLNFTHQGATWREGVKGLTGDEWEPQVFDYFEGEIRDKPFPSKLARRALRLDCYAGVVVSENGVHRLTGAIAWLCSVHSEQHKLRKVRTLYHSGNENLLNSIVKNCLGAALVEIAEIQRDVWLGERTPSGVKFLLRTQFSTGEMLVYGMCNDGINLIPWDVDRRSLLERMLRINRHEETGSSLRWVTLPRVIINAWAERGWLEHSLRQAERCPKLTA